MLSKWLLPYLLLLFVPLVLYGYMYAATRNIVHKQTQTSNHLVLQQLKQNTDAALSQVRQAFAQLYFQDMFQPDGLQTPYDIHQAVESLRSVSTSYPAISNIFVYNSQSDFVISPASALDSKSYFEAVNPFSNESYDAFMNLLLGRVDGEFFQSTAAHFDGSTTTSLIYHKTVENGNMAAARFHVFIAVSTNSLYDTAADIGALDNGLFSIVDNRSQQRVLSYGEESLSGCVPVGGPDSGDNCGAVTSVSPSDIFDLNYYMVMPENHFWQEEHNIQRVFLISLLFCLALGVVVIASSIRTSYNPLKNLAEMIRHKTEEAPADNLSSIYQGVNNMIEQYSSIVSTQNASLRTAFLQRFIHGREEGEPLEEHFREYDIRFESDQFAVVLIYIEDFTRFFAGAEEMSADEKFRFAHLTFTNIFEELCTGFCLPLYVDLDFTIGYVINFKPDANQQALPETLEKTRAFVKEHFGICTSIAVSDTVLTPGNVPVGYNQALETLDYREVMGIETVITHSEISAKSRHSFYYPLDMEQQLINCVKAGDFDSAKSIVDTIYQNNFSNQSMSLNTARCLMFNMISTMIKALNSENGSLDEAFDGDRYIARLFDSKSLQEHQQILTELLGEFCKYRMQDQPADDLSLSASVTQFVAEHYTDINLSVAAIAKQFEFHPTYLSNVYKKQTGKGLLDVIKETRVEASKKLLREGLTVDAAAAECGFTNSKTFIRTFKAVTGLTPGKYKELK